MSERIIVKVQVPIVSTEAEPPYLIYPEDRNRIVHEYSLSELEAKMSGRLKAFFYATWNDKRNCWVIGDEAPWQDW